MFKKDIEVITVIDDDITPDCEMPILEPQCRILEKVLQKPTMKDTLVENEQESIAQPQHNRTVIETNAPNCSIDEDLSQSEDILYMEYINSTNVNILKEIEEKNNSLTSKSELKKKFDEPIHNQEVLFFEYLENGEFCKETNLYQSSNNENLTFPTVTFTETLSSIEPLADKKIDNCISRKSNCDNIENDLYPTNLLNNSVDEPFLKISKQIPLSDSVICKSSNYIVDTGEKSNPFKCSICKKEFRSIVGMNFHIQRIHTKKTFECLICNCSFAFGNQLKSHMKSHTDNVQCNQCLRFFRSQRSLNVHKGHAHKPPAKVSVSETVADEISCNNYKEHTGEVHGRDSYEESLKCKHCGIMFNSKRSLSLHNRIHDRVRFSPTKSLSFGTQVLKRQIDEISTPESVATIESEKIGNITADSQNLLCSQQKRWDPTNYNIDIELNKCDGKKLFVESEINTILTGKSNVKRNLIGEDEGHKKLINSEKNVATRKKIYGCSICNKSYFNIEDFSCHKQIHKNELDLSIEKTLSKNNVWNYKCWVCGKFLFTQVDLFNHMRSHSKPKSYKCNLCHKVYRIYSKFCDHQISHNFKLS